MSSHAPSSAPAAPDHGHGHEEKPKPSKPAEKEKAHDGHGDAHGEKPKPAEKQTSETRKKLSETLGIKAKGGDGGAGPEITPEMRKKIIEEHFKEHGEEDDSATPWEYLNDKLERPIKTGAKVGLFLANPLVYGAVAGADWLAQRTPGVRSLYKAPREIVRGTVNKVMDVMIGGATLVPAAPVQLAHEIHDRMFKMDTSKPRNAVAWVFDKAGDLMGDTLELGTKVVSKTVEKLKKIVPPILGFGGKVIAAPFNIVGDMYSWLGKQNIILSLILGIPLTLGLVNAANGAIAGVLAAAYPAALPVYQGLMQTLLQTLRGILPI